MARSRGLAAYVLAFGTALSLTVSLTSCLGTDVPSDQAGSAIKPSATLSPTQSPPKATQPPTLDPDGTAQGNLEYFDVVNERILEDGNPGARAVVDNLVAAGFVKANIEVTADKTAIGGAVDSLQFAVKFGEDCLIGQAGGGPYSSTVGPSLGTGRCLVGKARPIDW